jgi:hypothetical protein
MLEREHTILDDIIIKGAKCGCNRETLRRILKKSLDFGMDPNLLKYSAATPNPRAAEDSITGFSEQIPEFKRFIESINIHAPYLDEIRNSRVFSVSSNHRSLLDMVVSAHLFTSQNLPYPIFLAGDNLFTEENEDQLKAWGAFKFERGTRRKELENMENLMPYMIANLLYAQPLLFFDTGSGRSKTGGLDKVNGKLSELFVKIARDHQVGFNLIYMGLAYSNIPEEDHLIRPDSSSSDSTIAKAAQEIDLSKAFLDLPSNLRGPSYVSLSKPIPIKRILDEIDSEKSLTERQLRKNLSRYSHRGIAQTVPVIDIDVTYAALYFALTGSMEHQPLSNLKSLKLQVARFKENYQTLLEKVHNNDQLNTHFLESSQEPDFLERLEQQNILELTGRSIRVTEKGAAHTRYYARKLYSLEESLTT